MQQGFIKVYRKITDNPLWFGESFSRGQAWIDLILLANHKENQFRVRGALVTVRRGQIGWSEVQLANRWKWSRGKVRRFLHELEVAHQIVQQKNNITSLITINNYDIYQSCSTPNNTTNGQQIEQQVVQQTDSKRYTNKNVKNIKNEKNTKKKDKEAIDTVLSFGESGDIKLTKNQYNKLLTGWGASNKKYPSEDALREGIDKLDTFCRSKGKRYKDYYATLQGWVYDDIISRQKTNETNNYDLTPSAEDWKHVRV